MERRLFKLFKGDLLKRDIEVESFLTYLVRLYNQAISEGESHTALAKVLILVEPHARDCI